MESSRRSAALAALVLGLAGCIVKTDLVASGFNGGALDSANDPFRDPADLRTSIVARLIAQELPDGYFAQGRDGQSQYRVHDWMRRAAGRPTQFLGLVKCFAGTGPCGSRRPMGPSATNPEARAVAEESLPAVTRQWTGVGDDEPICKEPGKPSFAVLEKVLDDVRFGQAVTRAAREVAAALTEHLVDEKAVEEGARAAFERSASYIENRRWRRERERPATALVVKGGAATGIYSAGAVWTALQLIHGCMSDEACARGADLRFKLVSGTSTGAMVAIAVDRFNSAKTKDDREREIKHLAEWFTCFSISDLYCVQSRPITDLFTSGRNALRGVLRFDGIEKVLRSCVDREMVQNRSELILNTVEFRSGRIFSMSDQAELGTPACVVQAGLASSLLPLIGEPVVRLPLQPFDRPYDPSRLDETEPAFLDGGIRSEIPVLPLVRRGAERVLVVSSGSSITTETARLANALDIAVRYIAISTGGVTESELQHAQRHAESLRAEEIAACYQRLRFGAGPRQSGAPGYRKVCSEASGCNMRAICETARWDRVCSGQQPDGAPDPGARTPLRTDAFWRMEGIFRDEGNVDGLNGYDFDPPELRRLFHAGADAARLRCFDLARLFGVVPEGASIDPELERKVVGWCSRRLEKNLCGREPAAASLRSCKEAPPDYLDACQGFASHKDEQCGVQQ